MPVERAAALRLGMPMELVDAQGQTLASGQITFLSPQVNEETQSVLVKTVVQNAENVLRAAQFVRARVVWSTHEGVMVPAVAILRLNGQSFVFVAEDQGGQLVARQRPVALGELLGEGYPVLAGLKPGERVVTAGIQKMADGAPIMQEKAATGPKKEAK